MTPDQRFAVITAGMGLMFTILTVTLGVVVRAVRRFTQVEDRLADVMQDVRDDRKATNERLTYLERYVWPKASADPAAVSARPPRREPRVPRP